MRLLPREQPDRRRILPRTPPSALLLLLALSLPLARPHAGPARVHLTERSRPVHRGRDERVHGAYGRVKRVLQVVIANLPPSGPLILRVRDPLDRLAHLLVVRRVQAEGSEAAHEFTAEVHVAATVFHADVVDVVAEEIEFDAPLHRVQPFPTPVAVVEHLVRHEIRELIEIRSVPHVVQWHVLTKVNVRFAQAADVLQGVPFDAPSVHDARVVEKIRPDERGGHLLVVLPLLGGFIRARLLAVHAPQVPVAGELGSDLAQSRASVLALDAELSDRVQSLGDEVNVFAAPLRVHLAVNLQPLPRHAPRRAFRDFLHGPRLRGGAPSRKFSQYPRRPLLEKRLVAHRLAVYERDGGDDRDIVSVEAKRRERSLGLIAVVVEESGVVVPVSGHPHQPTVVLRGVVWIRFLVNPAPRPERFEIELNHERLGQIVFLVGRAVRGADPADARFAPLGSVLLRDDASVAAVYSRGQVQHTLDALRETVRIEETILEISRAVVLQTPLQPSDASVSLALQQFQSLLRRGLVRLFSNRLRAG
mmetsp:Transcript_13092/g.56923  ORF Transcript_13092/g.56923 Transcript_13092/m.56923 type:complete len:534 (-) Transcript_13092:1198-2799(-)